MNEGPKEVEKKIDKEGEMRGDGGGSGQRVLKLGEGRRCDGS